MLMVASSRKYSLPLLREPVNQAITSRMACDQRKLESVGLISASIQQKMIESLRRSGIQDKRVLHAMRVVPRHIFIDTGWAAHAYQDIALAVGHGQTISKPSVVAKTLELVMATRLANTPSFKVLEIGTGCGYQAALLSHLAQEVYSIERIKPLFERAKSNLRPLRVPNLRLHYGDGCLGLPQVGSFDVIVLAAATVEIPLALRSQLAIGGRCIAPIGAETQVLTVIERISATQWRESKIAPVFFVPLKKGLA
jgi:protein-L-isoaspartate(D-aspartate) O-methyltransferase